MSRKRIERTLSALHPRVQLNLGRTDQKHKSDAAMGSLTTEDGLWGVLR